MEPADFKRALIELNALMSSISHLKISNIGTNTHAQVDTHIALTNAHLDWTIDQGATNIHAGNYIDNDTTYVNSDWDHDQLTNFAANEHFTEASINHANITAGTGNDHSYINQSVTTAASPTFVRATLSQATGTAPLTVSSTTKVTNLNADYLDGANSAETSTASTIVKRNSSGDINTRLFRSEYDSTNPTCNYIMTQIDTATNNYMRPSTKAQLIASLALMKTTGGTFTGAAVAADHGTAATDQIVNVCYGTGNPPTASTTTIGTLFIKYTA